MKEEISIPDIKTGGVYALINRNTGRMYIGETEDIRRRCKAHINLLKSGKHNNSELQNDYNNNYPFEIIVLSEITGRCNSEKRLCAEDYYIECFRRRGIKLYNSENDKNTKESFFILASRNDASINNVIKMINT